MADVLLEIYSEEIPAGMQSGAADQLVSKVRDALTELNIGFDDIGSYVTPQRLVLTATGLPTMQADQEQERRGPRSDAPEKALEGFLRSTGLTKEDLEVRNTPKGDFYFAVTKQEGKKVAEVLSDIFNKTLNDFHWPKSMRWSDNAVRWVRPMHSILCIFDGQLLPVSFGPITSNNTTKGHRFMAPNVSQIASIEEYKQAMNDNYVMLDKEQRKNVILDKINELTEPLGLQLSDDPALLDEVAGLVEYPVPLLGKFEERFMSLPKEVLVSVMRYHQKFFVLLDKQGKIAPYFIGVSNVVPKDGNDTIVKGYERVLTARLEDAAFFWQQDLALSLDEHVEGLANVVFHAKLGTVEQKAKRIAALAKLMGVWVPHTDLLQAEQAAKLAKADLVTQMVGEFAELQGIMGYYYALEQGLDEDLAIALKDHYKPQGVSDDLPENPLGVVVSLADKVDTLVGLFVVGDRPTGSKDPYALRRAALGVIRIILDNHLRIPLGLLFEKSLSLYPKSVIQKPVEVEPPKKKKMIRLRRTKKKMSRKEQRQALEDLIVFFEDRLRVLLKDSEEISPQIIQAVFDDGVEDDMTRLVLRARALKSFLATKDGERLSAAYKRAANIVAAEEKKDDDVYQGDVDKALLTEEAERGLYNEFSSLEPNIVKCLKEDRFEEAMKHLSGLCEPIDTFFDQVTVNAQDKSVRRNRLMLLSCFTDTLDKVANFECV